MRVMIPLTFWVAISGESTYVACRLEFYVVAFWNATRCTACHRLKSSAHDKNTRQYKYEVARFVVVAGVWRAATSMRLAFSCALSVHALWSVRCEVSRWRFGRFNAGYDSVLIPTSNFADPVIEQPLPSQKHTLPRTHSLATGKEVKHCWDWLVVCRCAVCWSSAVRSSQPRH